MHLINLKKTKTIFVQYGNKERVVMTYSLRHTVTNWSLVLYVDIVQYKKDKEFSNEMCLYVS